MTLGWWDLVKACSRASAACELLWSNSHWAVDFIPWVVSITPTSSCVLSTGMGNCSSFMDLWFTTCTLGTPKIAYTRVRCLLSFPFPRRGAARSWRSSGSGSARRGRRRRAGRKAASSTTSSRPCARAKSSTKTSPSWSATASASPTSWPTAAARGPSPNSTSEKQTATKTGEKKK